MIDKLIALANNLDKIANYSVADYIDSIIKTADTFIFYHGTSSVFLHSILKKGLDPAPSKKVWEEGYRREPGSAGMESFPGTYITSNFIKALSSAEHAVDRFGGNPLIVVGQAEDRAPEARIDEDHVPEPGEGIAQENNFIDEWYHNINLLETMAFFNSDEELEKIVKTWLEKMGIGHIDNLIKPGKDVLRAWLDMRVALALEKEQKEVYDKNMTMKLTQRFGEGKIPTKYLNPTNAINEYRKLMDVFLTKAKQIISKKREDINFFNIRLNRSITYKGANKIYLIVEILPKKWDDQLRKWAGPAKIIVRYIKKEEALSKLINDYKNQDIGDFVVIR